MNSFARFQVSQEPPSPPADSKIDEREAILSELERILASRLFRSAGRSQQFLRYVVEQKLAGHSDQLKERTIGTDVFLRQQGYSTGDDPVVRVQAGEVRRRIEQYYQAAPDSSPVRIELPVGSYSPVFLWSTASLQAETQVPPIHEFHATRADAPIIEPARRSRRRFWIIAAACLGLTGAVALAYISLHRAIVQQPVHDSTIKQFWNPVLASQQSVVVCLGSNLLRRLDPNAPVSENDSILHTHYGVPVGDVYAALAISTLLGKMNKPSQLRIGSNCSFDDLRNSPAVSVGAFNNKWTLQMVSNLRFAFVSEKGIHTIRELPPGNRTWQTHLGPDGHVIDDYAIVSRLLDSTTGQFTVTVAGIGTYGTQAAGDFVTSSQYLEEAFRNAPHDWAKKDAMFVLETTGTDSIAGPPHVLASYFW